ncbi:MAG: DUF421 domain-containing protein [Propionibacteriaceae bacterium]|jgi:uncharacterized membrane protein YcaP (DUF421 family)|nr:DUF421 domain-containing protein [Propionibacteriaceae bacterium]
MFQAMWDQLGITGWQALAVVVSTTVLFWVFTFLMSYLGQQMRARVTVTSFALMAVIGSVTARSMLGNHPTMSGGIIALLVLFAWEAVFRILGSRLRRPIVPVRQARVVLTDGVVDEEALKQAHVRTTDLMVRLRHAGITHLSDAGLVIVERDGTLTVIRAGQTVDEELLAGVVL